MCILLWTIKHIFNSHPSASGDIQMTGINTQQPSFGADWGDDSQVDPLMDVNTQ